MIEQLEKQADYWKNILERLMSIVGYLAENNLAFRGSVDRLYAPHNGF